LNPTGHKPPPRAGTVADSSDPDVVRLAGLISDRAPQDGPYELCVSGPHVVRHSRPSTEPMHIVPPPCLCVVAQGAKCLSLGKEEYRYDASRMLVFSVAVPVASRVTRASPAEPYLAFRLDLDPRKVAELTLRVYPDGPPRVAESRALYVDQSDRHIVNAVTRLLELMVQAEEARLLAPLVIDEVLIRLLRSPVGAQVAQVGIAESGVQQIATAVAWLRANFPDP
jgi:hypothetical protein